MNSGNLRDISKTVIASEAKTQPRIRCRPCESRDPYAAAAVLRDAGRRLSRNKASLWLWVPAFAGTTAWGQFQTQLHDLAAQCARGWRHLSPSWKVEGAGKAGCALHPRSRVQNADRRRTRAYRFSGGNPAFPARRFTAYFALSPATGSFATVIRGMIFRELDTDVRVE